MIHRASQAELETLASACGVVPFYNTGEPWTERANVYAWGDPIEGCFLLEPVSEDCVEAHVFVSPSARGARAFQVGKEFVAFIKQRGLRIIGVTPKDKPHAYRYARMVGLSYAGETHESWFTYGGD